jgi:hypothetical protein
MMKSIFFFCTLLGVLNISACFAEVDTHIDSAFFSGQAKLQTMKALEEQFGFRPCSVGGAAMVVVRTLSIQMETSQELSIDEARRIAIKSVELFQRNTNRTKELRPFLIEYPFPTKRLELSFILFDQKTGEFQKSNGLSIFRVNRDKIQFVLDNPITKQLETFHEENLLEAQEIVHQEELSITAQTTSPHTTPTPPATQFNAKKSYTNAFFSYLNNLPGAPKYPHWTKVYYGPNEERSFNWFLDNHCQKFAKKQSLGFIRVGDFTDASIISHYSGSFVSSKKLNLNEGRILAANLFEHMYPTLQQSFEAKSFRVYLRKLREEMHYPIVPENIEPKELCFKIVFWDDNIDRIMPPHLAQILLLDGVFSYYEADPKTQELRLVLQEPYEETLAFRNKLEKK